MRIAERILLLAAVALAPSLRAEESTARRLGAPAAVKLDWGINAVRAADIDGDGRTDLAMINNESGRIEVLLRLKAGEKAPAPRTLREDRWTPRTDDAPFRRLSLTGSVDMGSLEVADLDGSKRVQIAYTAARDGLTVVSRDKSGEWTVRKSFARHDPVPGSGALIAADLDGSGRKRLVMLSKSGLLVFPAFVAGEDIPEPKVYRTGVDNPTNLDVADLDHDGVPDIAYIVRGDKPELHVRFGLKSGGFGAERAFPTEYYSTDLSRRLPGAEGDGFAGVSYRKRAAEIFSVTRDDSPFDKAGTVSPELYATPSPLKSGALVSSPLATGAAGTVFVADPRGAAIQVYTLGDKGDLGEPVVYPAPANITAIASGSFNGNRTGVLAIGDKDGVLSYSEFDDKGRFPFPVPVKLEGSALAVTVRRTGGADGRSEALVVTKKDRKASLVLLAGDATTGLKTVSVTPLPDAATDAEDILVTPVGVLVTCGRTPAILLRDKPGAKAGETAFEEIAKDSPTRKSMLTNLTRADLGAGEFADGDAKYGALLVAAPGYVRALALDAKGDLVVKNQFNTRRPGDKPRAPFVRKDKSGVPEILFYNDTDKGLEWLSPDDKGVYRHKRTVLTGALDPLAAAPFGPGMLFVGRDRIAEVDLTQTGMKLGVTDRFETDLPGIVHLLVATGNFSGGKSPDMVLIDPRAHQLELVVHDKAGAWKSAMNFRLFDDNPFYRGRRSAGYEPHDGIVADLDGDGFDDLVLLMHDRVLVYPSEPADKAEKAGK